MSQIHSDPTCPCHEFSAKSPSETYYGHPRLDTGLKIDSSGPSASEIAISVPTFEQEWHDAPRWVTRTAELDKLQAVLFDVIDQGYQCEKAGGLARGEPTECNLFHPWQFTFHVPETDEENQQRARFVDEVMKRLKPNTQIANYWFIRGQHAKEVELVALLNLDLTEMVRVARERVIR